MKKTAFEKRLKRRIIAQDHIFFASCAPGLKNLLGQEIAGLKLESKNIVPKKGGIEFFGKIHDCYMANLHLRIPIRILMRIKSFKAENFSTLEKKFEEVDWELLLTKDSNLNFHVSTKKSRLYHTDAIAERAGRIISGKLSNLERNINIQAKACSHDLFIRGENNRFEISLDSSGELLHKRGIKENTTHAPLRENLAWAALMFAGFSENDVLIDPMCGSGTFSLEASMLKQKIPPGFARNFAFQSWQCFRKEKWGYIKQQAQKSLNSNIRKDIFASDIDDRAISSIQNNIRKFDFNKNIEVNKIDFFDIRPEKFTTKKGVIVINPPYGKRIGSDQDIYSFYDEVGKKLVKDFKGWKVGVIMPEKHLLKNHIFQKKAIRSFYHGGLDIFLLTGRM
jgi:putative N6-adenine-specific DNA methylase